MQLNNKLNNKQMIEKRRLFYGYYILAGAFILQLIVNGVTDYTFSLYVTPLQTEFGWSRGDIMSSMIVYNILTASASPFVGRIVDKYSIKKLMITGTIIFGAGLIFLATVNNILQFNIYWGLVGIGKASIAYIPITTIIFNWFQKRRGLALGIMGAGVGTGGFIMSPIVGGMLIPNLGWRASYGILGAVSIAVIVSLSIFVFKIKPADMGLNPDGVIDLEREDRVIAGTSKKQNILQSKGSGLTLEQARKTPAFWFAIIGFGIFGFAQTAVFQNHAPNLRDIGFAAVTASLAVSMCGLGSAFGKFSFGLLCDKIKPKYSLMIGIGMQLIAVLIIMSIHTGSPTALVVFYSLILGFGIGCWLPSLSMITSTTFGMAHYGSIYGIFNLVFMFTPAFGPYTAGRLYDATGNYHTAFILFIICFAISLPLVFLIRRPKW